MASQEMGQPKDPYALFLQPDNPVSVFVSSKNLGAYVNPKETRGGAFPSLTARQLLPNDPFLTMLHNPAADEESTLLRQSIVGSLVEDPVACVQLADSMKPVYELQGILDGLFDVPKSELDKADAINGPRYRRPDGDLEYRPKSNLELYVEAIDGGMLPGEEFAWVEPALQKLPGNVDGIRDWAEHSLPSAPHDFFIEAGEYTSGIVSKLPTLTEGSLPDAVRHRDHQYIEEVRSVVGEIATETDKTRALTGFARLARNDELHRVTIGEGVTQFTEGSNFYKAPQTKGSAAQVRNDSLPDVPVNVLSGGNMSGKSFTLEREFAHAEVAQAMGYAPSTDPFIDPIPSLAFVDRSSTDAGRDLSAFGSEVKNWAAAIGSTRAGGRLFADEAFSTTSPLEQAILLEATLHYLQTTGVQATVATHNEMAVERLETQPGIEVSHLGFSVEDGKPVYAHSIEPGADDSHAIEVAAGLGMPDKVLDRARAYLSGDPATVHRRKPEMPEFVGYEDAERDRLKEVRGTPQVFIPGTDYLIKADTRDEWDYDAERFTHVLQFEHNRGERNVRWENVAQPPIFDYQTFDHDFYDSLRERFGQLGMGFARALLGAGNHQDPRMLAETQRFYHRIVEDPELAKALIQEADKLRLLMYSIHDLAQDRQVNLLEHFIEQSFDSFAFHSWNVDVRYAREAALTVLDLHGIEPDEELARKLEVMATLEEYYVEEAHAAHAAIDRTRVIGNGEDSNGREARDEVSRRWRDRLIDLCVANGGDVHVFEYDIPETGEHIVSKYPQERDLLIRVVDEVKAHLKSLPELRFDQGDFDSDTETGRRRLDRIALTTEKFFDYHYDDELPQSNWFFPGATAHFVALNYFDSGEQIAGGVTDNLRAIDSVAAHQYANYLDWVMPQIEKKGMADGQTLRGHLTGSRRERENISFRNFDPISIEIDRMRYLFQFAENLRRNGFQPAVLGSSPRVLIQEGWNPLSDPASQVKNSWDLGESEQFLMVTGANMSGKTNGLKQLAMTQVLAQVTGMAPAETAQLPVFDKIVYMDRADTSRQSQGLSAFGTEVDKWKRVFDAAEHDGGVLVLVDEAFSTTSPMYQEALTYSSVINLARRGVIGAIATHNHAVVDRLLDENPHTVRAVHFETVVNDDGEAEFAYRLTEGHDQSKAIAVARAIGGLPEELLVEAERLFHEYEQGN
jgi:DNA mismatch repair ATPase MutS